MQLAPVFPIVYQILKPLFPDCLWSLDLETQHPSWTNAWAQPLSLSLSSGTTKKVALTFDDGPHPQHTPELLAVLQRYGIQASFFCLGNCIQRDPGVCREIYEHGHWLGLHGYDHQGFHRLSPTALKRTLERTQAEIAQACALDPTYVGSAMRDVRPPNGLFTPQTLRLLHQWGYRPVMWSVVPEDWVRPGVEIVIQRVMQQVRNGSVIVLHDGYCGGQDVAVIADRVISLLLHQGYEFVGINEFWSLKYRAATTNEIA